MILSLLLQSERPGSGRPLPIPKAEVSKGLPQKREMSEIEIVSRSEPITARDRRRLNTAESSSSKSSSLSDGVNDDTPRVSNSNLHLSVYFYQSVCLSL